MALFEYTYKIKVIVEFGNHIYEENKKDVKEGCNHIDNIPSIARYMGQKIRKRIERGLK